MENNLKEKGVQRLENSPEYDGMSSGQRTVNFFKGYWALLQDMMDKSLSLFLSSIAYSP